MLKLLVTNEVSTFGNRLFGEYCGHNMYRVICILLCIKLTVKDMHTTTTSVPARRYLGGVTITSKLLSSTYFDFDIKGIAD
jgi:hypothetical protein